MELVSKENNSATVQVYGLSKSKPHKSTSLTGIFTKDSSGEWRLITVSK